MKIKTSGIVTYASWYKNTIGVCIPDAENARVYFAGISDADMFAVISNRKVVVEITTDDWGTGMTDLRGSYWKNRDTGQVVRIMGEIGGHPEGTHWGRPHHGLGRVILRPNNEQWVKMDSCCMCPSCGMTPDIPLELHNCDPTNHLVHMARRAVIDNPEIRIKALANAIRSYDNHGG